MTPAEVLENHQSGLHYNYYRTYDPTSGRYIESDPNGLRGGLNTFNYVDDNPLLYFDNLGLAKVCYSWDGDYPHRYICVRDECAGNYPWTGNWPNCPGGGRIIDDSSNNALLCSDDPGGNSDCERLAYDECVLTHIGQTLACSEYDKLTNNCLHWVSNIRTTCRKLAEESCAGGGW